MYKTGTIITPQKIRRQLGELAYFEQDPDVGFHLENVATANGAEGADYDLYVANGYQHALMNVLCGLNDIHGTLPDRLLVPSTFFNTTNHTNEATATAAFIAAFAGINLTAPQKGSRELIPVARHCEVEFNANAAVYIAGTLLTVVWDATAGHIVPNKFKATADPAVAIARVVETTPVLPTTGTATRVRGLIQLGNLPA